MAKIDLRYGSTSFGLEYDSNRFEILAPADEPNGLNDREIGELLDNPIGVSSLEESVPPRGSVLIVVPDATRKSAAGQIVNLLVRRLIANGTMPFDIGIIFATGIHRSVTEDEKQEILTPFIAQRVKTIEHKARDIAAFLNLGETSGGVPIELNRVLVEADHVITVGSVNFHYFAGFTGGRKLICPGLASQRTIAGTHRLAFDQERLARTEGVGPGRLDGNPVHEAFIEAASMVKVSYAVNTIVNDAGEATDVVCGDLYESHREACRRFAERNLISINEKRAVVVASCGGYPHDINMIQAHKTLEAATGACEPGGTIILLAECRDGMGRTDFLDWFGSEDSNRLAQRLAERYQVNGQTAWSLLRKAEEFDIRIVSRIAGSDAAKLRMSKWNSLAEALGGLPERKGYLIPNGSGIAILSR
ncbi:MAG TPA: nickel-dependent lactate racemase [Pyrinomonadaceae bacterium]|nr:nickel-dependent lactate racemase [Pyrinomonadaceae bacterium]HMP66489.1 nickel-dependent lactate racemase [Pyrinomonadaceae bacterium]